MPLVYEKAATNTVDDIWEFTNSQDLSIFWQLGGSVTLTGNATGGGGVTLDVTLESRDLSGVWIPRWHAGQLTGADTAGEGFVLWGLFQQTVLSDALQTGPNNPTLAAGAVINGYFAPPYQEVLFNPGAQPGNKQPSHSWRWNLNQSGVGNFPIKIVLYGSGVMEQSA